MGLDNLGAFARGMVVAILSITFLGGVIALIGWEALRRIRLHP